MRLAGGVLVLGALVLRLGADPFVDGVRRTTAAAIAVALGITVVTTVCSAWRWSLVARRLGSTLPLRTAVAAYYRSQFVNATLPGGVLGDVQRGFRYGRATGDLGAGLRGVAWERTLGLLAYTAATLLVVAVVPSPLRPAALGVVALGLTALAAAAAGGMLLAVLRRRPPLPRRVGRVARAAAVLVREGRAILGAGPTRWMLGLASVVVVVGHTAILLVAVATAGAPAGEASMLPVAMVVLLATVVPVSVAGWGPREVTAAGAFGVLGLSPEQGVTVAVVYGVLAMVATWPGAVLMLVQRAAPPVTELSDPQLAMTSSRSDKSAREHDGGRSRAWRNARTPC